MAKSCGLKRQIRQVDPKMGYFRGPNKALTKSGFLKDQIGLIWGEPDGRREKKRGGRGRREEEEGEPSQKGMETTLSMNFVWITWNLRLDMVNLLSLNLGF